MLASAPTPRTRAAPTEIGRSPTRWGVRVPKPTPLVARPRVGRIATLLRLGDLVRPDRVHGSLYTDPAIFALELERIWCRTWVYVGHASEVPEADDYVLKSIGPQPVIMTRDRHGD